MCLLFAIPLYNEPRNNIASAKLKLWENSPANVDGILPPHIEFASINKNGMVNNDARIGAGCLNFISLNEKKTAKGKRNVPATVSNLNEICNGIIKLSKDINRNANGK